VPFATFLKRIGADLAGRYVGFKCADNYYQNIDMPTALHAQTLLTLTYDGKTLPREYGFPMKLRMPTKLDYKNPKHITALFVTNTYPDGYWEDQGYNWFGAADRRGAFGEDYVASTNFARSAMPSPIPSGVTPSSSAGVRERLTQNVR
jgi:DMSO/TMAO reductase YedYZ molybdopterin-dependent catalytic subunit